mgnify:CR=1 FL=1
MAKLSVSKLDYTNHEFVTGAKMQILEKSSGKIVAEWTTGDSAESFERKLNVDTSYIYVRYLHQKDMILLKIQNL